VAHLGNYLFHELTTPLGLRLDHLRQISDASGSELPADAMAAPMRSFGTFAVWFPRGLLLHLAAKHACRKVLDGWLASGDSHLSELTRQQLAQLISRTVADPALQAETLAERIEESTQAGSALEVGQTPGEVLAALLVKLEEQLMQPLAQDDPGNWAKQALTRVREWVGAGGELDYEINEWRKTRLTRSLGVAAQKLAEEWEHLVSAQVFGLMEQPGARLAGAELAFQQLQRHFIKAAETQKEVIAHQAARASQAWLAVDAAAQECHAGNAGFRLFGGRSRHRQLRVFLDKLAHFARLRLGEEVAAAVRHLFVSLAGRLQERLRDLGFCRQRLRFLYENLEAGHASNDEEQGDTRAPEFTVTHSPLPSAESFWEVVRHSGTARVVLPDGEEDLERAAFRFLQSIQAEHWLLLDKELHEMVLTPRGGLHGACMQSGDLIRTLAVPLLEEAGKVLSQHLPLMDVAQIITQECQEKSSEPDDFAYSTREYIDRAAPRLPGKMENKHFGFLLVPASPAGKTLGDAIHQAFPQIKQVRVPGQSDMMVCREQSRLTAQDLQKWLKPCRDAYEAVAAAPTTSAHARFDIVDWLPLNP
jgi:hypothetical protein